MLSEIRTKNNIKLILMVFPKSILWFAKNEASIKANTSFFNRQEFFSMSDIDREGYHEYKNFNFELDTFSYAFENSMWKCYWTCLDFIDWNNQSIKIFERKTRSYYIIAIDKLHERAKFTIFKYLGSVEAQREEINKCIEFFETHYKGVLINHPKTMKYFINKKYLDDMREAGFPNMIENTRIFANIVSYQELEEIANKHDGVGNFIIKPLTGELANSLKTLSEADENYLRYKENKVGGWILQPINSDIWHGEYRLVFFGEMCTLGLKKIYLKKEPNQKIPIEQERFFVKYMPSVQEMNWAMLIKNKWEKLMDQKIYYFRLDFVKNQQNKPAMLEFEALNPGFGFSVIPDKERKRIANEFICFLNFYTF